MGRPGYKHILAQTCHNCSALGLSQTNNSDPSVATVCGHACVHVRGQCTLTQARRAECPPSPPFVACISCIQGRPGEEGCWHSSEFPESRLPNSHATSGLARTLLPRNKCIPLALAQLERYVLLDLLNCDPQQVIPLCVAEALAEIRGPDPIRQESHLHWLVTMSPCSIATVSCISFALPLGSSSQAALQQVQSLGCPPN